MRQRSTSRSRLPFQGRQQVQQEHQQIRKKPQQPFGLQQQQQQRTSFIGGGSGVKPSSKYALEKQKYCICIDCYGCDCDPANITKSIKSGVNGLNHLTVCAPCKTNPSKIFKRSYTLPRKVQHNKMVKSITPLGHCVFEFPMWDEEPQLLDIELMPLQKIKTPEGKKAYFVQVPILPIMDPAKVKVCIVNCNLIVKFEHKKTIGDICSRVFYCCEVPLPKTENIDFSSIVCKQKKHVLNITVPTKREGGMVSTPSTGYREVPVQRKLRHRKQQQQQQAGVVGEAAGISIPRTTMQQQKQKPSTGISGLKQQQQQQQKQKQQLKKPQQQKTSISTGLQQPTQQKQQPSTVGGEILKPTSVESTTTPDITKQKKSKSNVSQGQQQYPKHGVGVSKGSDLLESVFGFGGGDKSKQQQQPSSTGQQQQRESAPTQLEKGVQQRSHVSDTPQVSSDGPSSSQQQQRDVNKPDISSSSEDPSAVSGSVIQ